MCSELHIGMSNEMCSKLHIEMSNKMCSEMPTEMCSELHIEMSNEMCSEMCSEMPTDEICSEMPTEMHRCYWGSDMIPSAHNKVALGVCYSSLMLSVAATLKMAEEEQ